MWFSHHHHIANVDHLFLLLQVGVVVLGGFSQQTFSSLQVRGEFEQFSLSRKYFCSMFAWEFWCPSEVFFLCLSPSERARWWSRPQNFKVSKLQGIWQEDGSSPRTQVRRKDSCSSYQPTNSDRHQEEIQENTEYPATWGHIQGESRKIKFTDS